MPLPLRQRIESTMVDCTAPPPDPNHFAIAAALAFVAGVMIGLVIR